MVDGDVYIYWFVSKIYYSLYRTCIIYRRYVQHQRWLLLRAANTGIRLLLIGSMFVLRLASYPFHRPLSSDEGQSHNTQPATQRATDEQRAKDHRHYIYIYIVLYYTVYQVLTLLHPLTH